MATLYDAYGHKVDLGRLREEVAAPSLTSIRQVWGDHVAVGLTPQRLANILKASEQGDPAAYLALAEEMEEKDLHYRAQLGTRKLGCAGLPLVVEAASDAAPDQKAADLVREVLGEEMEDTLVDSLDALGKGFSACEVMWETSGRAWVPNDIFWRDPRWFGFDPVDGHTVKMVEAGGLVDLPPFKFIVHRPKLKSGLPIRGGLARASAWAYLFANYGLKDWVAFLEIFGQPLRMGKYPAGADPDQVAVLKRAVRDIGSDAAAVIPDNMLIEFIETKVSGSTDGYERMLRYLDGRVTLAVLGQNLTSGQTEGGGGSYALGTVHNEVRKDLMRSDARQLMATFHRHLVRPLVDLNLGPQKHYPKIRLHIKEPEDLQGLTTALKELVPLGLKVEQSVIRDKLGLPDPPKGQDVELLTAKAPAPAPPPPEAVPSAGPAAKPEAPATAAQAACLQCGSAHAQGAHALDAPDALDRLAQEALADWVPQMQPLVSPLVQALQQSQTFDELKQALASAAQQMDPAALAQVLAQAGFVAALAGQTGVELAEPTTPTPSQPLPAPSPQPIAMSIAMDPPKRPRRVVPVRDAEGRILHYDVHYDTPTP